MKKPGLIVAAYPGMGQEIYASIYDDFYILSSYDYNKESESWAKDYVKDALKCVEHDKCKVCFIDPHKAVIKHLGELKKPFIIFYPGTPKDITLRTLATSYFRTPTVSTGKALADVVLNHDERISELRLYPNSIQFSNGFINEELIKQLIDMDDDDRRKVMNALGVMKTTPKSELKS